MSEGDGWWLTDYWFLNVGGGHHERMVVGFTTTYAIGAYYRVSCEFEIRSQRGVHDTTLCNKLCQWLVTGLWFSPGTEPVLETKK